MLELSTTVASHFPSSLPPEGITAEGEISHTQLRPKPFAFAVGEVVGGVYELTRALGEGAGGRVFEAFDRVMKRKVAIKFAHDDPHLVALLHREAEALAAIRHMGSVMPYHVGTDRNVSFLVMELLGGITLDDLIERKRARNERFTIDETVDLLLALTEALAAVHRSGIAHRDVKPQNIVIASGDRVVLVDFGLVVAEVALSRAEALSGTPAFMAPEVISNEVRAGEGHLVDLYAVGVIAYELLTGDIPFVGDTVYQTWSAHLMADAPDVSEVRQGVPARLAALVRELLAKTPRERPATAETVAWVLNTIKQQLAVRARARPPFVLIVDDDPDIGTLVAGCVHRHAPGVEVAVVESAEEALTMIAKRRPTLMMIDLAMPKMNGIELCMDMRGAGLSDDCAIVAMSGSAVDRDVGLLFDLGVTHFVPKDNHFLDSIASIVTTTHPNDA